MTADLHSDPHRRSVLVVEDEDSIALAIEFVLSRQGYAHRRAALGREALESIRALPPDLVLLDIMLPDISGYEIIETLRADPALRGTRVLMMTARGSVVERRKGLELGADGFIAKPFELNELRAEIARLLDMV